MAQIDFDTTGIEPLQPFDVLPRGEYLVAITASEMKATAAGTGQYLQLEMTVLDGDHSGRKLWSRLNLQNPNQTAEDIARRELAAICHSIGVTRVTDSEELHDKPFVVEVIVEKRKDNGAETNRIKAYWAADGTATPKAPQPAAAPSAKPAAAKAAPPWQRSRAA